MLNHLKLSDGGKKTTSMQFKCEYICMYNISG